MAVEEPVMAVQHVATFEFTTVDMDGCNLDTYASLVCGCGEVLQERITNLPEADMARRRHWHDLQVHRQERAAR